MRAFLALTLCILLLSAPAILAQSESLPEPDFAAIARMAQRVEPGRSYVVDLPARRQECKDAATPYLEAGVTQYMAWGGLISNECHYAMLLKMAELYYKADAFGPGGMPALLKRLRHDVGALYNGIYQGVIDCQVECGSYAVLMAIGEKGAVFEDAVQIMALQQGDIADRSQWYEAWKRAGWGE